MSSCSCDDAFTWEIPPTQHELAPVMAYDLRFVPSFRRALTIKVCGKNEFSGSKGVPDSGKSSVFGRAGI